MIPTSILRRQDKQESVATMLSVMAHNGIVQSTDTRCIIAYSYEQSQALSVMVLNIVSGDWKCPIERGRLSLLQRRKACLRRLEQSLKSDFAWS